MKPVEELWIGLAQVVPSSANDTPESQQPGAMVNVLALATDEKQFVATVKEAVASRGLTLASIDDVETYAERVVKYGADDEVAGLAAKAENEQSVQFATFQPMPPTGG